MIKNVALIPLRGGSKGIPKKNIKLIAGKPLCAWVLESAVECNLINKVYVSTDSEEIAQVVDSLNLGVKIIMRPPALASDSASTESVMLHFAENIDFDVLTTIQATSPLLTSIHLENAIKQFTDNHLESLVSAVRIKRFFWNDDNTPINYQPENRPRRQDFKGTLMENGAFYLTSRAVLEQYKCRLGGNIGVFEMPEETMLEIDEPDDWNAVEKLLIQAVE